MSLPRWTSLLLAVFASLALASLLQGVGDIVLPTARGGAPFGFLFATTRAFGPLAFSAYVFVHNFGLACLVPGVGFVAARYERRTRNRGVIGVLLVGAVLAALLIALEFLIQANDRFDPYFAFPLFVGESTGVLLLALPSARELWGFVPTPAYEWSLVTPFRKLLRPALASAALLLALALLETWWVVGF